MNTEDVKEKLEKMEKEMRGNMGNMAWALGIMAFAVMYMLTAILCVTGPVAIGEAAFNIEKILLVSATIGALTGSIVHLFIRPVPVNKPPQK